MKQNGEGMKKVLCIGDAAYYIIVSGKEGFVHSGAKSKAEQVSIHVGGCASGTAVCLAKLGIETALCCRIGVDMPGRQLVDALSREGVDMQYAVRDPELPTAASVICEDTLEGEAFSAVMAALLFLKSRIFPVRRLMNAILFLLAAF